ncbi:hypothetical protein ACVWZV_004382 [Bradyrhizobium sp. GM5.1]
MCRPALWPSQIRPASFVSAYFFAVWTNGASQLQPSVPGQPHAAFEQIHGGLVAHAAA